MRVLTLLLVTLAACKSSGTRAIPAGADAAAAARPTSDAAASVTSAPDVCTGGMVTEEVSFASADGLIVHGTLSNPCGGSPRPLVVLAHQMCSDRTEWTRAPHDWVVALAKARVATLAIDLRGHGKSKSWPDGRKRDLCKEIGQKASAGLYAAMVDDVKAAVTFARTHAHAPRVGVAGASIGSNAALVAFGDDAALAVVVALSPGVDYRGIAPEAAIVRAGARPLVLVAAEDDAASAAAVRGFEQANPAVRAGVQVFTSGGHGNHVFEAHPEAFEPLVAKVAGALSGG